MRPELPSDPADAIEQALARLAQCPGFDGVVLATADGLVLACRGSLNGDAAAACAASLSIEVRNALRTADQPETRELMLWGEDRILYQAVLPSSQLVLAVSRDPVHAGALRLAVRSEMPQLQAAMAAMTGTLNRPHRAD